MNDGCSLSYQNILLLMTQMDGVCLLFTVLFYRPTAHSARQLVLAVQRMRTTPPTLIYLLFINSRKSQRAYPVVV